MPTITLEIFDHAAFLALVALLPWNARRRFHSLAKAVDAGDPTARTRAYRTVVVEKWVLTAVIAVAWIALSRSAASIGLIAEHHAPCDRRLRPHRNGDRRSSAASPIGCPQRAGPSQNP